jgi:hypothetical protein
MSLMVVLTARRGQLLYFISRSRSHGIAGADARQNEMNDRMSEPPRSPVDASYPVNADDTRQGDQDLSSADGSMPGLLLSGSQASNGNLEFDPPGHVPLALCEQSRLSLLADDRP